LLKAISDQDYSLDNMAPSESLSNFFSPIRSRRSIYGLSAESPIADSEIEEIVKFAIEWCPSPWNVQSARAVILFGAQHQKLWEIVSNHMATTDLNEHNRAYVSNRMSQFKRSYGTVSGGTVDFVYEGPIADGFGLRWCGLRTRIR
jgi:hypothetical protein